jgi:hypothetical protein
MTPDSTGIGTRDFDSIPDRGFESEIWGNGLRIVDAEMV